MRIDVVTLFPELVQGVVEHGIPRRAIDAGLLELVTWNPRDYAQDRHRTVDDRPYGGGPGMVMRVEPLRTAIAEARNAGEQTLTSMLSPQGRRLDQDSIRMLSARPRLLLVAGRYEGVDERLVNMEIDEEWSLGDYVLSGGELAAMVVVDAVTRLLPGALGDEGSAQQDSFTDGLLDFPHYTRPEVVDGKRVPEVLLGGHHEQIQRWRRKQALGRTWLRRPDLLETMSLNVEDMESLEEFIVEHKTQNIGK